MARDLLAFQSDEHAHAGLKTCKYWNGVYSVSYFVFNAAKATGTSAWLYPWFRLCMPIICKIKLHACANSSATFTLSTKQSITIPFSDKMEATDYCNGKETARLTCQCKCDGGRRYNLKSLAEKKGPKLCRSVAYYFYT